MNRETLKGLLVASAKGMAYESNGRNFSVQEINKSVQEALKDYLNVTNERDMRSLGRADFAIVEEVIEELTPKAVEDIIGQFAEVRTFGRNEQVFFTIKNVGAARVMRAIVPGARAGIYKARRIDNKQLDMETRVETVGYALSLEDLLTGRVTMNDYVTIITQGFVEVVYQRMIGALRAAAVSAPAANRVQVDGTDPDVTELLAAALDNVSRVVGAYGDPTIFAFDTTASLIANYLPGVFPQNAYVGADANDIREMGRVAKYKGKNVVVLPNFLTDNSNSQWLFKEDELFILPASERPIKVAFAGNLHIQEVQIPSGGVEYHAHRAMGVSVLMNQAIGSIEVTGTGDAGLW